MAGKSDSPTGEAAAYGKLMEERRARKRAGRVGASVAPPADRQIDPAGRPEAPGHTKWYDQMARISLTSAMAKGKGMQSGCGAAPVRKGTLGALGFTIVYLPLSLAGALWSENHECLFYIGMMVPIIAAVAGVYLRINFSTGVLWGLSLWCRKSTSAATSTPAGTRSPTLWAWSSRRGLIRLTSPKPDRRGRP